MNQKSKTISQIKKFTSIFLYSRKKIIKKRSKLTTVYFWECYLFRIFSIAFDTFIHDLNFFSRSMLFRSSTFLTSDLLIGSTRVLPNYRDQPCNYRSTNQKKTYIRPNPESNKFNYFNLSRELGSVSRSWVMTVMTWHLLPYGFWLF